MFALLAMLSAASGNIGPLLQGQGFVGPINGREKIEYVGHIAQGRNDYRIYVYRGVFRAAVVDHGVNKIIVILNRTAFLGDYSIPWPTHCKLRGKKVICKARDPAFPAVIEFTKHGPPRRVWFDGEVFDFSFGNKFAALRRPYTPGTQRPWRSSSSAFPAPARRADAASPIADRPSRRRAARGSR